MGVKDILVEQSNGLDCNHALMFIVEMNKRTKIFSRNKTLVMKPWPLFCFLVTIFDFLPKGGNGAMQREYT